MNQITAIYMNNSLLRKSPRYRITEVAPRFHWAVASTNQNAKQSAYSLQICREDSVLWDTGWVETSVQEVAYEGTTLPADCKLIVRVMVRDNYGEETLPYEEDFYVDGLHDALPGWIAASEDDANVHKALYFRKAFSVGKPVKSAVLYVCGLGCHQVTINGQRLDDAVLDPLHSDYAKNCYYVMLPEIQNRLQAGANCLSVVVGDGWRRSQEIVNVFDQHHFNRRAAFMGQPQLSASLRITYADGQVEVLNTDETWLWKHGPIVHNSLMGGETYDARESCPDWNLPSISEADFKAVAVVEAPGPGMRVMTAEPITEHEVFTPRTISRLDKDTCLIDFGVNIAGYSCIRLPKGMQAGQTISLYHSEMLDESGDFYVAPLRGAIPLDTYIASGDDRDLAEFKPIFNYHGFRYVKVTGWPLISKEDIVAINIYSDVDTKNFFSCGSPIVNTIQRNLVQTEKDNIIGIFTDCPQRDERQGWMNDATVRMEETPYNFNIARLFPKVVQDILDTQAEDGSITCTAPFVFGSRPADVVCSTFLVTAMQGLMHTGNREIIAQAYEGAKKWEGYLTTRSIDHIVQYSHYGDWAGPAYSCLNGDIEQAQSQFTPGIFMSTGYYYFNAKTIARFAELLGKEDEKAQYEQLAADIRAAMLREWWDEETGKMCTGSQGCQAFSLWLGIIPEDKRDLAALRLHEDLVEKGFMLSTGNLNSRYIYDVLTQYGYLEDAWKLITREEYPSIGHMIQHEATTIWERFELKKSTGMNSHNHPMYGAVGYWFYAYLAGIKPAAPGFTEVDIRPYFPEKLLSAQAEIETPMGALTVHWLKRFGKTHLHVQVPFGVKANVTFNGETHTVGSGFWTFEAEGDVQ